MSIGNLYYHRLAEAFKHVFAIRLNLGDPDYVNTTDARNALLDLNYMTRLQKETSDDNVLPLDEYGGIYNITRANSLVVDHGTTHLSVIDSYGNAVALTSTINTYFGSKVMSSITNMLYNNEMDDFSIPGTSNYFGLAASPYNYPAPFKRPLSSMSPSFVYDKENKLRLVGGASGGPRIITATAQVILNYFGKGLDILDAVIAPRLHSQLLPNTLYIENNTQLLSTLLFGHSIELSDDILKVLHQKNHFTNKTTDVGITQFIVVDVDTNTLKAVSDPRKGGLPSAQ